MRLQIRAYLAIIGSFAAQMSSAQPDNNKLTEDAAILNLNFCRPAYPHDARLRSEYGVVKLQFTVGANGRLVGSSIVKSSGFRDLDTAALTALIHCNFKPAYRNNLPVQASFTIDYKWMLGR